MSRRFGWCQTHQHGDCTVSFKRIYFGPVKKGRKTETGLITLDEIIECSCKCHKKGKK